MIVLNILLVSLVYSKTLESVYAPPKFGDRIGKLKRVSTLPTLKTTIAAKFQINDNDIRRSDEFFSSHNNENKHFFLLNESGQKKSDENFEVKNVLADKIDSNNKNSLPSSPLVQARLEMVTDFFDVPPLPLSSVYSTPSRPTSFQKTGVVLASKSSTLNSTLKKIVRKASTGLRREGWVIFVLALSTISMTMMGAFEIFVLCKTRRTTPNRRHLFLGQMLLLGLFTCAGLSTLLTANPTVLSCATIRFGTGLSFAIVFASLLVKCIFLISLNGGVYLPAIYQGLLLLFAVLIQITINVQWLLNQPAKLTFFQEVSQPNRLIFTADNLSAIGEGLQLCKTSFSELRISLIYIDFLIILVAILAIKSRGVRDNYREAMYIGLAIALVIPIWLGFTLVGLAVNENHTDGCLAFGLLATSTIVFLVMFMPKGRQLAAMGREDIYMQDREERFSVSSREAGSGYSPSFFHFKPIKYGVMSGKSLSKLCSKRLINNLNYINFLYTGTKAMVSPTTDEKEKYFRGKKQHQIVGTVPDGHALSFYTPHINLSHHHHYFSDQDLPIFYFSNKTDPQYEGLFMQNEADTYTTLEQTQHSSNPNVFFQINK